ncbi:MAG: dihydroneopterin aldolase [Chlorobiaceae bacterium]|nr:dihydroneopterin aldolase [Chlorobiaceae bacterium]
MNLRHRSCIRLVNAIFYAQHGVHAEEQRLGGKYEVDAELIFDSCPAAETDDLSKTVNYQLAYASIRTIMTGQPTALIETLAYRIAVGLMEEFPVLDSVTIRVRKINLPLGGLCDYAEAEHRIEKS